MKKKKISLVITIIMVLVVMLGTTYAFYFYARVGNKNQVAITGDIYMNYLTGNQINITNCVPMSKEEALASDENVFNFQIIGKNTSNKDIYYGISLANDVELAGKTRIKPENIDIYLKSEDTVLLDAVRYKSFDDTKIWVDTIPANTNSEITKNYSLKIWIDENILISDTEANADYTTDEWANSYVSLKVNVDGKLDEMNMPLSLETNETYVENNKAYFIAKVSNYLDISQKGRSLETADTMNLVITGTNSDMLFAYKDSEGNEVTTGSESLTLNYNFTTNKTVEVKVFVIPKNDANGVTDINIKLTKNSTEVYEMIKRITVKGNNYCLNNGFNKLGDCMLVSENLSDDVETAKTQIANKGSVNLDDTAPSYTYVEETTTNVSNAYTAPSGYKYYFGTGYSFNSTTGTFKLTGTIITDNLSDTYLNYYTCGGTNYGNSACSTIYKILGTDSANQKITLADKTTYKIASTLRSEVGLYQTEDDYGTSYFYRGDAQNNNVYFGGFYWKIIRMNGDGSIRLIYSGTTPNATGNNTSINNTGYKYSDRYPDPTYVGYMRGEDFALQTSNETTASIVALTKYYFADNYTFDEGTKTFTLSGNISEAKTFSEMNALGNDGFAKYQYTCMGTKIDSTCQVLIKVNSYVKETQVKAQYIAYSSTSLEATRTDDVDSNAKYFLDTWYENNIIGKTDSNGVLLTSYIVDGSFCNDRSFYSGNGYSLVPYTLYSGYKRLYVDSNKTATLKCSNPNDNFSTTTSRGNTKLKFPVALITADEVALGGAKYGMKNQDYYLRTNGYFWTMTPSFSGATARVYFVSPLGTLDFGNQVTMLNAMRAVINLRSDVLISQGDGTSDNPYILKLS